MGSSACSAVSDAEVVDSDFSVNDVVKPDVEACGR